MISLTRFVHDSVQEFDDSFTSPQSFSHPTSGDQAQAYDATSTFTGRCCCSHFLLPVFKNSSRKTPYFLFHRVHTLQTDSELKYRHDLTPIICSSTSNLSANVSSHNLIAFSCNGVKENERATVMQLVSTCHYPVQLRY